MVNLKTLRPTNRSLIDPETGTEYRRMAGGLCWPIRGIPGFLILIGETWQTLDDRSHYGLMEMEIRHIEDAFVAVRELPGQYFFTVTPSNLTDYVQSLLYRNPALSTGKIVDIQEEISLDGDPVQFFNDIDQEIDKRSRDQGRSIYLQDCPRTAGLLQSRLPAGWKTSDDILSVPEVAALFYALGAFFLWKNWPLFG